MVYIFLWSLFNLKLRLCYPVWSTGRHHKVLLHMEPESLFCQSMARAARCHSMAIRTSVRKTNWYKWNVFPCVTRGQEPRSLIVISNTHRNAYVLRRVFHTYVRYPELQFKHNPLNSDPHTGI